MAGVNHVGKRRLMLTYTGITAANTQTTPTDLRGCKNIVFVHVVTACSGGADTIDAKVQASFDKVTWYDWITFTQKAAAANEFLPAASTAAAPIPRWARVVATPGAGATASGSVRMFYERLGDGSMAPTKAAITTPTGAGA